MAAPDVLHARLADAEAALERQEQQQQAISQGIAHDLRAPLRSIDSFSALLVAHLGSAADDITHDYIRRIRDASMRMGRLLDSLQTLSQSHRCPMQRAPVDLTLLAEWVGAELSDAHPGRAAEIVVTPGLVTEGDERLLKLMLEQVMANAWAFSRDRDRVEISIDGVREGDRLLLRVRDRGIGFDMRYSAKLFEPFQRLHGDEQGAGAGIGLAIAQRVAERHGGCIRAESEVGAGSVFIIELPATPHTGTDAHG